MRFDANRGGISAGTSAAVLIIVVVLISVAVFIHFAPPSGGGQTTSSSTTSSSESTTSVSTTVSSSTSSVGSTSSSTSTTTSTTTSSSTSTVPSNSSVYVTSKYENGTAVPGAYIELTANNSEVATGYTPVSFPLIYGQNYTVIVSDSTDHYFNHWDDENNFTSRVIPVKADGSVISLTAVFTQTSQPPPTTPYSISVTSADLNGTAIQGYYMNVRVQGYTIQSGFTPVTFSDLEPGLQYQVVAYWAGDQYFRSFAGGDLNRYELVTFNSTGTQSVSLQALYQQVPASEQASLNIIAEFPNGTVIGTTFNNTSYIQHTPGMWLTITPPNSTTPFTGTYTGGSILPFILFNDENYTIQMTLAYGNVTFSHWEDTGSTDATRSIFLTGNETLIAIYTES